MRLLLLNEGKAVARLATAAASRRCVDSRVVTDTGQCIAEVQVAHRHAVTCVPPSGRVVALGR